MLVDRIWSEKENVSVIVIETGIGTGTAKEKEIEMRVTDFTRFHLRSSHKCQIVATDNPHHPPIISNDINNLLNGVSTRGSLNSLDIHSMAAIIELLTWLKEVLAQVTTIVMKTLQTATEEITCQSLSTSK